MGKFSLFSRVNKSKEREIREINYYFCNVHRKIRKKGKEKSKDEKR